jgi:hypothetical protein
MTTVGWLAVALVAAGCRPPGPTEIVSRSGQKTRLRPAGVRVIAAAEASSKLSGRPFLLPFGGGRDGTELVGLVLAEAERAGAAAVGDINVTLATVRDGQPIECRTAILPETVTESRWVPSSHRLVSVSKPVSRMVTEQQYRCHLVSRPETRHVTEYQQRCRSVSRPVTRTRTTYSYQYSRTGSRSVPRTESYTTYESRQECHSEPVSRMKTDYVSKNECRYEPHTRMVTRYEHQLETQYVPPRLETFQRHRLRETEPVCYEIDAGAEAAPTRSADESDAAPLPDPPPAPAPRNRIEAVLYFDS